MKMSFLIGNLWDAFGVPGTVLGVLYALFPIVAALQERYVYAHFTNVESDAHEMIQFAQCCTVVSSFNACALSHVPYS